jgi:hypothetical protein
VITKSNKIAQLWEAESGEFLTTLRVGPRTNDAHPSSDAILDLLIRTVAYQADSTATAANHRLQKASLFTDTRMDGEGRKEWGSAYGIGYLRNAG